MVAMGRIEEGVACCCHAITVMPRNSTAKRLLGMAYYALRRIDEATAVYREWLEEEPGNAIAKHMLAACSGMEVPSRAADAFVEETFDKFADSFDAKLERLTYRAPQLVTEALLALAGPAKKDMTVLDAGCGTGLCGPLVAPYARRLDGVDLSGRMLAKAEQRRVYDELVKGELGAFLASRSDSYDLVLSADTLVYFGQLDDVLAAAHAALRPGGLLIFTVETLADDADEGSGYRINPHGRYSHSRNYLRRAVEAAGLQKVDVAAVIPRTEGGQPVHGYLVTGRKPGSDAGRQAQADPVGPTPGA
jgi:predicted TPR repeat methyltransferase